MKKVVTFNSRDEFKLYLKKKIVKEISRGSEGICYLGKDGLMYKYFLDDFSEMEYFPNDIITSDEVSCDSFVFPDVLFVIGGRVVGFVSKCVKRDLIDNSLIDDDYLKTFDYDSYISAYEVMEQDVSKLSVEGIKIFDLSSNIMFDGDRLYGIDTCGYYRTDEDVFEYNKSCLDDAVKDVFSFIDECLYGLDAIDVSLDSISYIREIEKRYKSNQLFDGENIKK